MFPGRDLEPSASGDSSPPGGVSAAATLCFRQAISSWLLIPPKTFQDDGLDGHPPWPTGAYPLWLFHYWQPALGRCFNNGWPVASTSLVPWPSALSRPARQHVPDGRARNEGPRGRETRRRDRSTGLARGGRQGAGRPPKGGGKRDGGWISIYLPLSSHAGTLTAYRDRRSRWATSPPPSPPIDGRPLPCPQRRVC